MKKYFLYILVIFIFLNAAKISVIENFIINDSFNFPADKLIWYRLASYLILNTFIFIGFLKFKKQYLMMLFFILQTTYIFIHFSYFLYFKDILHMQQILTQYKEGIEIFKHFAVPGDKRYFIILLDLPLFLFVMLNFSAYRDFFVTNSKRFRMRRMLSIVCFIFLLPYFGKPNVLAVYKEAASYKDEKQILKTCGLFACNLREMMFLNYQDRVISNLEYGKAVVFKNEKNADLKNIICVQVEALDAGVVNAMYKGQYVAPFLHSLSSECVYYPYMLSYCNAGATSDIEFSVINNQLPPEKFPYYSLTKYNYQNSIVKKLNMKGYTAFAFHNNDGSFFNRTDSFQKMGFTRFYDVFSMGLKEYGWGAKDEDVFNYVKGKLSEPKKPLFYYIITMSSHEPYGSVRKYYKNNLYDDIGNKVLKDYFNSISYVDMALKDLVLFIKNNVDDAYIFIFGDHHCNVRNSPLFKRAVINYDCNKRAVPLFIVTPYDKKYSEATRVASMLDLGYTMLCASGADFEIKTIGINLLDVPISEKQIILKDGQAENRIKLFILFNKVINE